MRPEPPLARRVFCRGRDIYVWPVPRRCGGPRAHAVRPYGGVGGANFSGIPKGRKKGLRDHGGARCVVQTHPRPSVGAHCMRPELPPNACGRMQCAPTGDARGGKPLRCALTRGEPGDGLATVEHPQGDPPVDPQGTPSLPYAVFSAVAVSLTPSAAHTRETVSKRGRAPRRNAR
jgi:hypothetical protein